MLLSLGKKTTTNTQKDSPFPTSVPDQGSDKQVKNTDQNNQNGLNYSPDISAITPVETQDFKLQFFPDLNKIVVEKKTPQAEQKFIEWANQNNYPQLIANPNKAVLISPGEKPSAAQPLLDFLNIFVNYGQGQGAMTAPEQINTTSSTNSNTAAPSLQPTQTLAKGNFVYFPQCGSYGDTPLPDGCNLCQAGCGPTAVSMIASSYLGSKYNPKAIVNLYSTNGYVLGCDGSRYQEAHELLKSLGLKTTDYLVFDAEKSETVVPDLKKYLNSGWTFFALANFCEGGCGHYFWITDIDNKGNIWAYDPAYGRYEIPYNENSRYPFPLYRLAFGVKK